MLEFRRKMSEFGGGGEKCWDFGGQISEFWEKMSEFGGKRSEFRRKMSKFGGIMWNFGEKCQILVKKCQNLGEMLGF